MRFTKIPLIATLMAVALSLLIVLPALASSDNDTRGFRTVDHLTVDVLEGDETSPGTDDDADANRTASSFRDKLYVSNDTGANNRLHVTVAPAGLAVANLTEYAGPDGKKDNTATETTNEDDNLWCAVATVKNDRSGKSVKAPLYSSSVITGGTRPTADQVVHCALRELPGGRRLRQACRGRQVLQGRHPGRDQHACAAPCAARRHADRHGRGPERHHQPHGRRRGAGLLRDLPLRRHLPRLPEREDTLPRHRQRLRSRPRRRVRLHPGRLRPAPVQHGRRQRPEHRAPLGGGRRLRRHQGHAGRRGRGRRGQQRLAPARQHARRLLLPRHDHQQGPRLLRVVPGGGGPRGQQRPHRRRLQQVRRSELRDHGGRGLAGVQGRPHRHRLRREQEDRDRRPLLHRRDLRGHGQQPRRAQRRGLREVPRGGSHGDRRDHPHGQGELQHDEQACRQRRTSTRRTSPGAA